VTHLATRFSGSFAALFVIAISALHTTGSAPARDVVKVRTSGFPVMAPFFVALAEGFFAEQGLQVEPVEMMAGASLVPALLRGDIDVLPVETVPAIFNAIARGGRLRIVGSQMQYGTGCAHHALVAARALAQSGALDRADLLRGRTYSMGTSLVSAYMFDRALEPLGLSTNDLNVVQIPDAARPEALRTGRLDLAMLTEPSVTRALRAGHVMWKSPLQLVPRFDFAVIVFGPNLLDSRPGVGQRFMTAYLRGVRQFLLGKTPRNLDLLTKSIGIDRETLADMCWPPVTADAQVNAAALMSYQQWLVAKGMVDRIVTPAEMIDARFLGSQGPHP